MNVTEWSQSTVDYGRKLVDSAVEGARFGEDQFLKEKPLAPFLGESARQALGAAAVGACLGLLSGYLNERRSTSRVLGRGFLCGAIGFGIGMVWQSRDFGVSIASGAWKRINKARDERWFERNPIDYA